MRRASPARLPRAALLTAAAFAVGGALGAGAGAGFMPGAAAGATTISFAACGIAGVPRLAPVPLAAFRTGEGPLPLALGPIRLSADGPPLVLRFAEVADGAAKRAVQGTDAIVLPILAGADAPFPDEITLRCRYDRLAAALYRYGDAKVLVPAGDPVAPAFATSSRTEG